MLLTVDADQQRQELPGLVTEVSRARFGDVKNDRYGVVGFADYML